MSRLAGTQRIEAANEFEARIEEATGLAGLHGLATEVIQVNIGLTCDLECTHCHVASSPHRNESMTWETMTQVLDAVRRVRPRTVDITGGAPELNPHFQRFVAALRREELHVLVRTNLTVFFAPGAEDIPAFYREHRVHVVASLPCYLEDNVDAQRGDGVFQNSIDALRQLNELGYGHDPALVLDLVYNPVGPHLPPEQTALEADYKRELGERYGIVFTRLLTITNMPIGRYWGDLKRQGTHMEYAALLRRSFNRRTLDRLMCRSQISVRWDGMLFDCDFNLALRIHIGDGAPAHIRDFQAERLATRRIVTGNHCFGCAAGCGSSCGGALVGIDD